ncbi:MAG: hypothetical protein PUH25_03990 [Spirochaetales bacterium]|nr:hypothetical protein [Spirochaetales bacterium]
MTILLFYGGLSSEHEISIRSEANIKEVLISLGYSIKEIFITKDGRYLYEGDEVIIIPQKGFFTKENKIEFDVAFPVLHGKNGEDGTIQALFEIVNVPYISEDIITSSIGMNKEIFHDLLYKKVPVIESKKINNYSDIDLSSYVLKPVSGGSSIGVYMMENNSQNEVEKVIKTIKNLDDDVLMQPWIKDAREIEFGVINDIKNEELLILGPVEIIKSGQLLSYDAKYNDPNLKIITKENINISPSTIQKLKQITKEVFNSLNGKVYMRVDYLVTNNEEIFLNEVNTIPGLTKTSHFIVLAKEIGFERLFNILINDALIIHEKKRRNNG